MNQVFIYVLSRNKVANFLFIISILIVALLDIIYVDEKELFNGGVELAKITSNIAMSLMAGYLFYIVTAVKLDADRINRSRKASEIVVKRILGINKHLFSQLSNSPHAAHSPTPDESHIRELLDGRLFSDNHNNKIYSNFTNQTGYKTLHYFLFDDCIPTSLKVKQELELYFSLLEPDLQIAFCEYFNCRFYSDFSDLSTKIIFKNREHRIDAFIDSFIEISKTALTIKETYEEIYGALDYKE